MKSSPGAATVAALGLLILAGAGACRNAGRQASSPVRPAPPEATTGGTGETAAAFPAPELGYNAREGQALFRHYCAPCHGEEGHGDGFNAFNLDPRPRDLGAPELQAQRSDEDLTSLLRTGGGAAGLSSAMPPWGRTLSERQIQSLLRYLRTLRPAQSS